MTTVANSTGVFATLHYNFDDPNGAVETLSANTQAHLNTMPAFIESWQAQDIANNTVSGYFKNPVANSMNKIIANTTIIYGMANNDPANTWTNVNAAMDLANAASSLLVELNLMLSHTNNVSGINDVTTGGDAVNDFPYQETASGVGRFMIYLTHESDGVLNSSPIIGSMTCLFIDNDIEANNTIVYNDRLTVNSSNVMGIITLSNSANTCPFFTSEL